MNCNHSTIPFRVALKRRHRVAAARAPERRRAPLFPDLAAHSRVHRPRLRARDRTARRVHIAHVPSAHRMRVARPTAVETTVARASSRRGPGRSPALRRGRVVMRGGEDGASTSGALPTLAVFDLDACFWDEEMYTLREVVDPGRCSRLARGRRRRGRRRRRQRTHAHQNQPRGAPRAAKLLSREISGHAARRGVVGGHARGDRPRRSRAVGNFPRRHRARGLRHRLARRVRGELTNRSHAAAEREQGGDALSHPA